MFKKNTRHQQPALISAASELPEKQRKRLENSWAGAFYTEFFNRIDENAFAVLYSEKASRPNIPVNVLVGLEALKAGFGWSDEELYENYCYNLQVRYALGYDRLGDGDFEIRTLYYFRERLSLYNKQKNVNLLEQAFEQITDAQITKLKVRTGLQRMDSTQIASNIVWASRLQLMVEGVQRVERLLSETDKERLKETFDPYIRDSAGHFTYRIKGKAAVQTHLEKIGESVHGLLQDLRPNYGEEAAFQVLERLFKENFTLIEKQIKSKANAEITSDCLQSVDDLEATFRTKANSHHKGYVANLTETCDPANEVQLITKVQVSPNNVDDGQLLAEALPNLKKRTDLETMVTDGGYAGPISDPALQTAQVNLIQTAIRGRSQKSDQLHLSDFILKFNQEGKPSKVTCPQGQTAPAHSGTNENTYVAHFDQDLCHICPLLGQCPVRSGRREPGRHLRFTQTEARAAERRRSYAEYIKEGRSLRPAVEASVRSLKHPFPAGKVPVRGRFRISCMIIASAAMTNVRRIHRYTVAKLKAVQLEGQGKNGPSPSVDSFFAFLNRFIANTTRSQTANFSNSGC